MKLQRRNRFENWERMQKRIVAETSLYLSERLNHPELAISIPAIPAGTAKFPKSMTAAFWRPILFQ